MQFSTTPTLEGQTIVEYCGVVTGEAILGANIFRDFFAGIRDIVGGRSGAYEKELRKAREIAFEELGSQARALGLSKSAIFFRLVMPQMWRHALPGLGNQWLVLLKDTALVSLISVNDLMLQTKSIATRTQEPFTWYIVAAAIYLVITLLSQYILKRIDLRATRFERRPS